MDFANNIFSLQEPANREFNFIDTKLPSGKDVYFRAKQKEIIDQYAAARVFLQETETEDWSHWFEPVEDEDTNKAFQLIFSAHFYEVALMYYNIVVDLSWTLCYVSAEFVCSLRGTRVNLSGIKTVEDAYLLLRSAESCVTTPTAENNPFEYLRKMCPDFADAIQIIVDFWNSFSSSEIRKKYNFCKHKGKPAYSEIEALRGARLLGFYRQSRSTGERIPLASDIRDVQWTISLADSIEQLRNFDDIELFPYIKALFEELERVVQPSPMV